MLHYIHYKNNHLKRDSMLKKIIEMGYFWNGITGDVVNAIKICEICYSEGNVQKLEKNHNN